MQQTTLDRWLKSKLVHQYSVYCNTLCTGIPEYVEPLKSDIPPWNWRLNCSSDQGMKEVITLMIGNRISYRPSITSKGGVAAFIFDPQDRSSFTFRLIWAVVKAGCAALLLCLAGQFDGLKWTIKGWKSFRALSVSFIE